MKEINNDLMSAGGVILVSGIPEPSKYLNCETGQIWSCMYNADQDLVYRYMWDSDELLCMEGSPEIDVLRLTIGDTELGWIRTTPAVDHPKVDLQAFSKLNEIKAIIHDWQKKSKSLVVTDESQTDLIEKATSAWKAVRKIRTGIEKKRKELKAPHMDSGKQIDGFAKEITTLVKPLELELHGSANFIEIKQKAEKEKVLKGRKARVAELGLDWAQFSHTEEFTDEQFTEFIEFQKHKIAKENEVSEEAKKAQEEANRKAAVISGRENIVRSKGLGKFFVDFDYSCTEDVFDAAVDSAFEKAQDEAFDRQKLADLEAADRNRKNKERTEKAKKTRIKNSGDDDKILLENLAMIEGLKKSLIVTVTTETGKKVMEKVIDNLDVSMIELRDAIEVSK